jgi:hypothetical protein
LARRIFRGALDLLQEQANALQESISKGNSYVQLNHGDTPTVDLTRVCGILESFRHKSGSNDFWGSIKVLPDMPAGKIAEVLIGENIPLGISARGIGSLKKGKDGENEVCSDYKLLGMDVVASPGFESSYATALRESINNGSLSINESASALSLLQSFEKDRARVFDRDLAGHAAMPSLNSNPNAQLTHLQRLEAEKAEIIAKLAELQKEIDLTDDGLSLSRYKSYADGIADPTVRAAAYQQLCKMGFDSVMRSRAEELLSRLSRNNRGADNNPNATFLRWLSGRTR